MGLSIAQWAVRMHGGRIQLITAPGEGCTFQMSLPPANPRKANEELSIDCGNHFLGGPRRATARYGAVSQRTAISVPRRFPASRSWCRQPLRRAIPDIRPTWRFFARPESWRDRRAGRLRNRTTIYRSPGLLGAFACSLGVRLTPENAPKIAALLNRANEDAYRAADVMKRRYQHKRPFQIEAGDVCVSPQGKGALERSPDYPSGHTALSWETGLILSELDPDHAIEILRRARAFGQSRVVCGVHNLSAVEAGWMTASAVFALQMSSPEFTKDLEAARTEFASLKLGSGQKPTNCQVEAGLLSKDPY